MENVEFYSTLRAGPWMVGGEVRELEGLGGPGDICVALGPGSASEDTLPALVTPS